MNRLLSNNTVRFQHSLQQRLFQFCLLLVALACLSVGAQAQWGRKWDLPLNPPTPVNPPAPLSEETAANKSQSATQEAGPSGLIDVIERQKKAIVGSWLVTVNAVGPPIKALESFTSDGILLSAAQGDVTTN